MSIKAVRRILLIGGALIGAMIAVVYGQPATNTVTRTDVTVGAVAVQLCPLNQARVDCSCTNNDGAIAFRVGDANITASRGQRVSGGGTFKASTTSRVFGIAESGSIVVSCTDQTR